MAQKEGALKKREVGLYPCTIAPGLPFHSVHKTRIEFNLCGKEKEMTSPRGFSHPERKQMYARQRPFSCHDQKDPCTCTCTCTCTMGLTSICHLTEIERCTLVSMSQIFFYLSHDLIHVHPIRRQTEAHAFWKKASIPQSDEVEQGMPINHDGEPVKR